MFSSQASQVDSTLYSDDVFSAYTYTGNGSTQTITNGIDLSGQGGLTWLKRRDTVAANELMDSVRGITKQLWTDQTAAQGTGSWISSYNSNGFSLGVGDTGSNASGGTYVSWTFRKAPKFFDVVTFTTPASGSFTVNHSLGVAPGIIIVKSTASVDAWYVYHTALGTGYHLVLNGTAGQAASSLWSSVTSTSFVGTTSAWGANVAYVAYFFAHDAATDGIIQCGSFTTDGSGNATVTLGWEPQFLLIKGTGGSNWLTLDCSRGFPMFNAGTGTNVLSPNQSAAESSWSPTSYLIEPTATGFRMGNWNVGNTQIYLAIRRPNKPPTSGTQVYNAIARTGTGAAATVTGVGFAPDVVISHPRALGGSAWFDRLRGANQFLWGHSGNAEVADSTTLTSFNMDGVSLGADGTNGAINYSARTFIYWFLKRAVGVIDEVCWTGDSSSNQRVSHGLGVVPELIISKARSAGNNWWTYFGNTGNYVSLESYNGLTNHANAWGTSAPTATDFGIDNGWLGGNGITQSALLFATKAGISKVGTYTGNGGTQTINCGFTTGARLVIIKRTDGAGHWAIFDTVRGIVAAADENGYLSYVGPTADETAYDVIDPDNSGFIINYNASSNLSINYSGNAYIYLAFA